MQTTTSYTYDALNRLTEKSYTSPYSSIVLFGYDGVALTGCPGPTPPTISGATNLVGRRSAMCAGYSASAWSFDAMGRPLTEARTNKGSSAKEYNVKYSYFLNGALNTLTYPSGDVVTYTVGGAGRATQVSDSNNSFVGYSGNTATYAPTGSLATMTNGYTASFAGIVTSNFYNVRLQPLLLSALVSGNAIFSLCYDFHLGIAISTKHCSFSAYATGDNGNVFQVLNNVDSTRSAAFIYDPLNRIAQAYTVNTNSTKCWGETYSATATAPGVLPPTPGIDTWGNLISRSGVSGMGGCQTEGLSASATNLNQLGGIGVLYDAAGNVTNDGSGNVPTYDDENRISTNQGYTYYYDGNGARMEKTTGSTGTMYWPDPSGENLAETSLTGTINEEYIFFNGQRIARIDRPSGTVNYYFSNHLESTSVITDAIGDVEEQIDYLPYGGIAYSSGSDPNHYKFTGKERDSESNLDSFGKRYYASTMGRWMSPDLVNVTEDRLLSPSSTLNKYAYAADNPLKYIDPDGQDVTYFYDQGGVAGHAILFAYNQATGDSAIESFGPAHHLPIDQGVSMFEMKDFTSADNLRQNLTSLTIQTTPELAQQVIDYIRANPDPALWIAPGPNCSSEVWKILQKFKLGQKASSLDGSPGQLPRNVWQTLIHQYNPSQQGITPKNGQDYGNPRCGGNSCMFNLMWLSLPQSQPKEVVTHKICYADDNGKQTCQ